jgi:hypothetical protein
MKTFSLKKTPVLQGFAKRVWMLLLAVMQASQSEDVQESFHKSPKRDL